MHFFDIANIAFSALDYKVSYIELIGTLFGLISVYYASRANILTWSTGIVNEFFLCLLFFQVQLYADMLLQVYFFTVTIYGWYYWKSGTTDRSITTLTNSARLFVSGVIALGTVLAGMLFSNIHVYLPQYFKLPAAYPYIDSLVMVMSIVATIMLAQKKLESWYLWLLVDCISVALYYKKGVYFLSLEYLVFLGLAYYGLCNWRKQLKFCTVI